MSICRENVDKRLNIAFLQENAVRAVSMGEGRLDQQQVFPELPSHDEADDDDEEDADAAAAAAAAADDDDDCGTEIEVLIINLLVKCIFSHQKIMMTWPVY